VEKAVINAAACRFLRSLWSTRRSQYQLAVKGQNNYNAHTGS